jgi:hypothetical protein
MANKNLRPNNKAFVEQCVALIGAFLASFQSWVSNSTCLKTDRLKGNRLQALIDVKNTRYLFLNTSFYALCLKMGVHPLRDFKPEERFRFCSFLTGSYEQTLRLGLLALSKVTAQ